MNRVLEGYLIRLRVEARVALYDQLSQLNQMCEEWLKGDLCIYESLRIVTTVKEALSMELDKGKGTLEEVYGTRLHTRVIDIINEVVDKSTQKNETLILYTQKEGNSLWDIAKQRVDFDDIITNHINRVLRNLKEQKLETIRQ